jgi:four helix bundle protein
MGRIQGDLKDRTFAFALSILNVSDEFPNSPKGWIVGKQFIRCGTSIGANIREADQAFSAADFAHKCNTALKEATETDYWLRLSIQGGLLARESTVAIAAEVEQLIRILVTVVKRTQLALES